MPGLLLQHALVKGETTSSCPACGSKDIHSLGTVPEAFHFCAFKFSHPINNAELFECRACDFHFKNPCLTFNVLDDLYRRQPSTVWGSSVEGREDVQKIGDLIEGINTREVRILDVGCYTGGLLRALAERFKNTKNLQLNGIEPSAVAAAESAAHGIRILGTSIHDLDPSECFDMIVLTDVFEHILHSKEFLDILGKYLAAGGYILLMTGAYDSAPFSKYRNAYHYCAMPEHLAFLSQRHAKWLAGTLRLNLVTYSLLSHARPAPSRRNSLIKSLMHWISRWIPVRWLSIDHPLAHEIARRRGMGVQNLTGQPDHAFAVFRKPPKPA